MNIGSQILFMADLHREITRRESFLLALAHLYTNSKKTMPWTLSQVFLKEVAIISRERDEFITRLTKMKHAAGNSP